MESAVVTGATSMLGIATVKECLKHGVRILAISRAGSKRKGALPESPLLTFVECDLSELAQMQADGEYDVFYHFGWAYTDKGTRDHPVLQEKNILYTLSAVELAHRFRCKRFVGAGSQAEYGFRDGVIYEDTLVDPGNCYGYCKFAAGKLAKKLCDSYGISCVWTRTFSVYGVNDSPDTMVSYALRQFKNHDIAYFSSGLQMWDYLHEADAAVYFYLLGKVALEGSLVVNVASGDTRSLKEYISEMAAVFEAGSEKEKFLFEFTDFPPASNRGIHPSVERLRKITGYVPQVSFREGIRMLLEKMRE